MSELFRIIDDWKAKVGNAPVWISWDFIESVREYYAEHDELTYGQEQALRNIIRGYKMLGAAKGHNF